MNGCNLKDLFGRLLVTSLLVVICSNCSSRQHKTTAALNAENSFVDSLLKKTQEEYKVPAMAAAVVRPNNIIRISATGLRRLGTQDSVTVSDHFHIGSNTKAMTAMVIAELVKQKKLSWDTTPTEIFPELSNSINSNFHSITLEQLLSHRAGIPAYRKGSDFNTLPAFNGTPTQKRKLFTKYLLEDKPANKPGTQYLYSNAGYSIATAMAEQISEHSWKKLMQKYLFQPLRIDGGFGWPAANDSDQPWGHWVQEGDSLQPHNPNGSYHDPILITPAGDINMSIQDYGKFLQLNLRGLLGMKTILLNSEEIKSLHKSRGPMTDKEISPGYSLGWGITQLLKTPTSSHAGSAGTFFAEAAIQPSRKVAVAVFVNAANKSAEQAVAQTLKVLLKEYGKK